MPKPFKPLIPVFLLLLSLTASAQSEESNFRMGVGASIFNLAEYTYEHEYEAFSSIFLPLDIGRSFRVEPSVGLVLADYYSAVAVGVGVFAKNATPKFNLLYGLRLGLITGDVGNVKSVAPALAGEYYFIENFSIGTEVQLRATNYNDFFQNDWILYTNALLLLRFYL